jgi:hypothetical protein
MSRGQSGRGRRCATSVAARPRAGGRKTRAGPLPAEFRASAGPCTAGAAAIGRIAEIGPLVEGEGGGDLVEG